MKNRFKRLIAAALSLLIIPSSLASHAANESGFLFKDENGNNVYLYTNGETIDTLAKLDENFKHHSQERWDNIGDWNGIYVNLESSTVSFRNNAYPRAWVVPFELCALELGFMEAFVTENGEFVYPTDRVENGMIIES